MAYPEHWLFQFGGKANAAAPEIWSCGIRLRVAGEIQSQNDAEQWLDDAGVPALTAWFGRSDTKIGGGTTCTFAKMNRIGPDGRYMESTTHERQGLTIASAGGGSSLPFQAALALTWTTDAASRGPASKGRIYLPHPNLAVVSTTGLFPAADALGIATSTATFLNQLDTTVGTIGTIRPHIVSNLNEAHHQIDHVIVDNRVDIQRRRANQLVPLRSEVDVNY